MKLYRNLSAVLIAALICAAFAASAAHAQSAPAQSETVIAEFDGGKITAEEINLFLKTINPSYMSQLQDPQMKEMLINQIVDSAILSSTARAVGIDKDPEVQAMLNLQTSSILASRYFDKEIKPLRDAVQISDTELKQYYDNNPKEFEQNKVKASHILVDTEEEAKEILKQVKAAPDTFAAVAKEKSKDKGSGANGGELGWFERGRMVPEFEAMSFSTPKGQISEPVKTRFGWHIINVEDKVEGVITPFEEAKENIKAKLLENKRKEVVDNLIIALKEKAHLKLNKELYSKVAPAPEAPAAPAAAPAPAKPAPPAPPEPKDKSNKKTDKKK